MTVVRLPLFWFILTDLLMMYRQQQSSVDCCGNVDNSISIETTTNFTEGERPITTPTMISISSYHTRGSTGDDNNKPPAVPTMDNFCANSENKSSLQTYLSEFLRQTQEYREHGTVEYNRVYDTISRFDSCFRDRARDDCSRQLFCSCDDYCPLYDNCCHDAKPKPLPFSRIEEVKQKILLSSCEQINTRIGYIMVSSCPSTWTTATVQYKCETTNTSDVVSMIPVYNKELKMTFKNSYCAQCHNISSGLQYWDLYIEECHIEFTSVWNSDDDLIVKIGKLVKDDFCRLTVKPFAGAISSRCPDNIANDYACSDYEYKHFFGTYKDDWRRGTQNSFIMDGGYICYTDVFADYLKSDLNKDTHNYIAFLCNAYHNIILNGEKYSPFVRNSMCNWCRVQDSFSCSTSLVRRQLLEFSVLINFTAAVKDVESNEPCQEREVFDTFNDVCRRMFCPGDLIANYGVCLTPFITVKAPVFNITFLSPCSANDSVILKGVKNTKRRIFEDDQTKSLTRISKLTSLYNSTNITVTVDGVPLDMCHVVCFRLGSKATITYEKSRQLEELFKFPYVERPTRKEEVVQVKGDYIESPCQPRSNSMALKCPYLEFTDLEFLKIKPMLSCTPSLLQELPVVHSDHGKHIICLKDFRKISRITCDQNEDEQTSAGGLLSLVLVSVSLLALVLTVLTYILHPDLRSVPCRICLNIMLALCVSYLLFILSSVLNKYAVLCHVIAVMSHYSWLNAFVLMLIYSCKMFKTFSSQTMLPNTSYRQTCCVPRQLLINLTIAHVVPTIVIATNFVLMHWKVMDAEYGKPTCFINNPVALLATFAAPVGFVVLTNGILFLATTVKLARFRVTSQTLKPKTNLLFSCIKMTSFLGLAWIFGILAAFTDLQILWNIHIIFNGSCGLFILISHVLCSRMIVRWYKTKFTNCLNRS